MKKLSFIKRNQLKFYFILITFATLAITSLLLVLLGVLLDRTGRIEVYLGDRTVLTVGLFVLAGISLGIILFTVLSSTVLKPLNKIIDGINLLAEGKFETRLTEDYAEPLIKVSDGFNKLAAELQNTELLRSDFINNFSHEFKTPIVSIKGFAKLLQNPNLSPKQRAEYAAIIEEEATRLSNMSTSVLSLSRLEKQTIALNPHKFNLTEQLRLAVLLLEGKWQAKNLDVSVDGDEVMIFAEEEALTQVWINIIDNAVKFADQNTPLEISVTQEQGSITVSVKDYGKQIKEEDRKRIFGKFWQADKEQQNEGTGLGLSIVKRIVELHGGSVEAYSLYGYTVFTVTLPDGSQKTQD